MAIALICAAAYTTSVYGAEAQSSVSNKIVLGAGDKISVRIPIEPKYTGEYLIDERGKFFLPIVDEGLDFGAFSVAGLTPEQAAELIKQKIGEYYADNSVTVELVSLGIRPGQSVSVFGSVSMPGSFRYFEGMRFLDLLLKMGSFLDDADVSRVALYRGNEAIRYLDVRGLINGTDFSSNIEVQPGDYYIIAKQIPATKIRVVVLGSVIDPGTVYVPEGTQLLDLIARVKGPAIKAAIGKTYIIRVVEGQAVVIHADLKALIDLQDLRENVVIKDGDIVFVPENSRVRISSIINSLLQLNVVDSVFGDLNNNN